MVKFEIVLSVIWFLAIVSTKQNMTEPQFNSKQRLIVKKDYYRLDFSYQDDQSNVPKSLKIMLKQMSIKSLVLQMGFINPSALLKTDSTRSNVKNVPPINHGISLLLQNTSLISKQNYQSIAQVFSISRNPQFITYLHETKTTYVSNPNDKFCAQHLKAIVDVFLPCKNSAGIGSIIHDKTFFVGKSFVGLKLKWSIGERIDLVYFLDKDSPEAKSYLKISEEKKYLKRCMHFNQFTVTNQQDQKSLDAQHISTSLLYTEAISTQFHSNYYNPQKSLFMRINLQQLLQDIQTSNKHSENSQNSVQSYLKTIDGRILFPRGFQVGKISHDCYDLCSSIFENIHVQQIPFEKNSIQKQFFLSKNENSLVKFGIKMLPNLVRKFNTSNPAINKVITLKIDYKAHLKPFQQYETIAGGGQQFSNIPFTVQMSNNLTLIVLSRRNTNMLDRLLEPDFSIPFKTITFTIAIFGYLWIAIWKSFYSQMQQNRKKQRDSLDKNTHFKEE